MLIKLKKHTRKSDNLRRLGHIAAAMTPQNYMDQNNTKLTGLIKKFGHLTRKRKTLSSITGQFPNLNSGYKLRQKNYPET